MITATRRHRKRWNPPTDDFEMTWYYDQRLCRTTFWARRGDRTLATIIDDRQMVARPKFLLSDVRLRLARAFNRRCGVRRLPIPAPPK